MKKGTGILILLLAFVIISSTFVFADNNASADKAYTCLEGKVTGKCTTLPLDDQIFALLALSYNSAIQSECKSGMMANSNNNQCWPKSSCNLKQTAQATLALQYSNSDSSVQEAWLLKQNKTADDLTWYLEVDAQQAARCKISYDGHNYQTRIATDKTFSAGAGSCLSLANNNYWLQISSSCMTKEFNVSCDSDFSTALLYKKTGSDVWHISSQTKSASSNGTTSNQVNSLCLKQGSSCNYEGTLWAVLALAKHNDVSPFLPYLIAMASDSSDNDKLNPSAFLYKLTSSDDFLSTLRSNQNPDGFWDLSSGYGKYYDTALSLYAIQGLTDDSADGARTALLDNQATNGCWQDSVKTTGFILFAGWPKASAAGGGGGGETPACESYGRYCITSGACLAAGGTASSNYFCQGTNVCCSNNTALQTCSQKNGVICPSGQSCSGGSVASSDQGICCTGTCQTTQASACQTAGNTCRPGSCFDTETTSSLSCSNAGDSCCSSKTPKKSYWWLWLLIILILVVVLGIVFRNQLRLWVFQIQNKFKKGPVSQTRPPFPPAGGMGMQRPMQNYNRPQQARPLPARPKSKQDSEMEETLRKLRDMSK